MIILTLALWIIGSILIVTDGKTRSTRWGSAVAFLSGLGGFATVWNETITPFIESNYNISKTTDIALHVLTTVSSGVSHYLGPYCIFMFGVIYSGELKEKWEKRLAVFALAPIVITFLFFPKHSYFMKTIEELTRYFLILSTWAVPYMICGNGFLVFAFIKEKNPNLKQHKLLTCIIIVPFITFAMLTNYILRAFGLEQGWRYNAWVIIIQFLGFMYFAAKYGVLGVRLKFERQRLDSTIKAMTSGTAILNHSIKNEVFKISICMKNIRNSVHKPNQDIMDIDENIQIVLDSTNHLAAMMKRIQEQMKEIILIEGRTDLAEIINKSLEMQRHYIEDKNIVVIRNYSAGLIILCDHVHITEVMNNIIKNAVEAMIQNGRLVIWVYSNKKDVVLVVEDNGSGISKENLNHVFDPFFSTKRLTMNFGLGLSYSYNVMQRHGGRLEIQSEENVGTLISCIFPKTRVLEVPANVHKGSAVYG